ncbi:MAG: hypothetical protein V7708_04985 [Oceanicoccus sp.]
MSTVLIVGASLAVLVAVGILLQTMDNKRKENRQREAALNARARSFDYMLNGFPEGFLHPQLKILICHCLIEVFSQLNKIDPGNTNYTGKLATAQQRLTEFSAKPGKRAPVTLSDRAQIREVQKMLSSLYNFVSELAASKRIKPADAIHYRKLLQRLLLQTTLDELINPIAEALDQNNKPLAIHYLQVGRDKMQHENEDGFYNDSINKHNTRIDALTQQTPTQNPSSNTHQQYTDKQWEGLAKTDDSWKKKSIYD